MDAESRRDFQCAGDAALAHLRGRLGFGLWMLTRVRGEDWTVLRCIDGAYGLAPGHVLRWSDSLCSRMVRGEGPRVAPDVDAVPAYAGAPIAARLPIRAYVGAPLTTTSGELFGTLCAMDPAPQPADVAAEQALVELLASMLGTLLDLQARLDEAVERNERLSVDALTDPLTGLWNRRAWVDLLAREEERCRRHGHAAATFSIDLDGLKEINDRRGHAAGDALLVAASEALREVLRGSDLFARLGGDEFGAVVVECDGDGARAFVERLRQALAQRGVRASIGSAPREPQAGLHGAFELADRRMYVDKRSHAG